MQKDLTINEQMEMSYNIAKNTKKQIELTKNKSDRIIKNPSTELLSYNDYPEAFKYVNSIFPDMDLQSIKIYKASPLMLKKVGYDGMGGFFNALSKIIVISSYQLIPLDVQKHTVRAKLQKDEILVHELLHYCHNKIGKHDSVNLKEEFAYGWSWGYLKEKDYQDSYILEYNYMPYLYQIYYKDGVLNTLKNNNISKDKFYKASSQYQYKILNNLAGQVFHETKKFATKKGQQIIDVYSKKYREGQVYYTQKKDSNIFNNLDLD